MLDIIIPVYKAKKTLLRILMNLAIQRDIENFNVYLVIDADGEDYDYEKRFVEKFYPIKLLTLEKNGGPGVARQYGIDNSSSPYIMFIDSDDYLYSPYSLKYIMNEIINTDFDLLITNFRYERDNEVIIKKRDVTWLHGKVYRRKFLVDNDIKFNDTRANEDNGFNRLLLLHRPEIYFLDKITYVYSENSESITRRNNRDYKFLGLEYLSYNIVWAIQKVFDKKININMVATTAYALLLAMYYYYIELYDDYDVEKILLWTKDVLSIYVNTKEFVPEIERNRLIEEKENEYKDKNLNYIISFDEFIKKVSDYND